MSSRNVLDLKRRPTRERASVVHAAAAPRRKLPLRVRRRRARVLWLLAAVLVLAGGTFGIGYASYLPQFTIGEVQVVGAQAVPPSVISAYVDSILYDGSHHFLSRQNIFLYPKEAIEESLVKDFPRLASAQLSRPSLLSQTLAVAVTERAPFAQWCEGAQTGESGAPTSGQCYLMDESGFIYTDASTSTKAGSPYVFVGGISTSSAPIGQTFAPGHIPGLIALFKLLSQENGLTATGAAVQDDQDFSVELAQGFSLKASYGENADTLAHNLDLILASDALQGKESKLEYIDLRFGDRVYYKMKGEAATSTAH
jgi:cell division septal protein FtsQ